MNSPISWVSHPGWPDRRSYALTVFNSLSRSCPVRHASSVRVSGIRRTSGPTGLLRTAGMAMKLTVNAKVSHYSSFKVNFDSLEFAFDLTVGHKYLIFFPIFRPHLDRDEKYECGCAHTPRFPHWKRNVTPVSVVCAERCPRLFERHEKLRLLPSCCHQAFSSYFFLIH